MKLLVDVKGGRVLYAEAGKDVVDFLFALLTLPVATVVKLLRKDAMAGCVASLYGSVELLDAGYVRSADARAALLAPAGGYESGRLLQLQAAAPAAAAVEVYQCSKGGTGDCYSYVAAVRSTPCRHCRGAMNVPIELAAGAASLSDVAGTGFVKEVVMYTVMDDLQVAPMSTISSIAALNALGITDISSLQEKSVRVGYDEGLEILRASLQSKTVLTDIFLGKKVREAAAAPLQKKKNTEAAAAAAPSDNKKEPKAATPSKKEKK
ncbi:hypothetical protein GQ55_5G482600 [Panicum hallii var. hallii]|uniref:DUF674 domain-containing protein n=1 Tax=Panicum hallii var. hallii TaxID=1504633 RepID=A0A2T7DRA0_9POAL|nr:hypothetical protein GQ55_5G482600 [Panicum hallii var. hallii]